MICPMQMAHLHPQVRDNREDDKEEMEVASSLALQGEFFFRRGVDSLLLRHQESPSVAAHAGMFIHNNLHP